MISFLTVHTTDVTTVWTSIYQSLFIC